MRRKHSEPITCVDSTNGDGSRVVVQRFANAPPIPFVKRGQTIRLVVENDASLESHCERFMWLSLAQAQAAIRGLTRAVGTKGKRKWRIGSKR